MVLLRQSRLKGGLYINTYFLTLEEFESEILNAHAINQGYDSAEDFLIQIIRDEVNSKLMPELSNEIIDKLNRLEVGVIFTIKDVCEYFDIYIPDCISILELDELLEYHLINNCKESFVQLGICKSNYLYKYLRSSMNDNYK